MSKWAGTGGLWYSGNTKASDPRPRWKGSWTCPNCNTKTTIAGFGQDQGKSQNANAPTIRLKEVKDE
jgi:hypothetical protein